MRRLLMALALSATAVVAACSRQDDGDIQVQTPDVDVSRDTATINVPNVPDVDVGTKRDTVIVNRPTVDVNRDTTRRP